MTLLVTNLNTIWERIRVAEQRYHRIGEVSLLAVSKTQTATNIMPLIDAGQHSFGENYVKEALIKISALSEKDLTWHFIGSIQTNKIKSIAQHFSWVQTVSRILEAKELSRFRGDRPPLNICIQVNLEKDPRKSGAYLEDVPALVQAIKTLPHLRLRGLMTLPTFAPDFETQCRSFRKMKILMEKLNQEGADLDTLSMGMTHDLEAAIAEGATMVRIGTGIFGPRETKAET